LPEYQKAPQVTRDRMYIDAMQQIYSNVTKVVVDSKQGSNLLYLPLDKIMQLNSGVSNPPPAADASSSNASPSNVQPVITPPVPADARSRDSSRSRDRDVR
jgi:membrane protease subunit HflK